MNKLLLRILTAEDEAVFIAAMQRSQALHYPWVKPPTNSAEFQSYLSKYQLSNNEARLKPAY